MRDETFEQLYTAHAGSLLAFMAYRVDSVAQAEDLVAEAFERAYRARRRFDPRRGSEKTWLYAIALNVLADSRRREAAERRALERTGSGQAADESIGCDPVDTLSDREALLVAIGRLGDEERTAIALRYGADLTLKEVARVTQASRAAVEQRIYRGLRKLREALEGP